MPVVQSAWDEDVTVTTIRSLTPTDYAPLVAIVNRLTPDFPTVSAEEFAFYVKNSFPGLYSERWLALADDRIVGFGTLAEQRGVSPPVYWGSIGVDPGYQGRGIGTILHDGLLMRARAVGAAKIYGLILANHVAALEFAGRRGFMPTGKGEQLSRLDVRAANLAAFEGDEERLHEQGIVIQTLAQLGPDDDTVLHRLYLLDEATHADIPSSEVLEFESYETWLRLFVFGYGRSADWCWVAMHGDQPVGLARLKRSGDHDAWNAFTGVDRAYRGRGIARALKYRTVEWSLRHDVYHHFTGNEAENERMLAINLRLGYQLLPREVEVVKTL